MSSCCSVKKEEPLKKKFADTIKLYSPLIVILGLSIVSSAAVSMSGSHAFMNILMGFFLLFLSALKLFNLNVFAASFQKYDVLAQKTSIYAYAYPFIELGLALLYFSALYPLETNVATILVMAAGCIGVAKVIRSGETLQCACVGNVFKLPVGRVTLFENISMAVMAALNTVHLYN